MKSNYLKKKKNGTSLGLLILITIVTFTISALCFGLIIMAAWNGIFAELLGAATMNYGQGVLLWIAWALAKPSDKIHTTLFGDDI